MAGKLTARSVESLAKRRGRFLDGDGLFLRVLDPGKRIYWTSLIRNSQASCPRRIVMFEPPTPLLRSASARDPLPRS
jgi:hypothetical protein